ncbi:complexin-3-like [Mantella aurantiaca]
MASMAKFLFGGPTTSVSCCTSGNFSQDLPPRTNMPRRWSSEDHHREERPETARRSSLHTQHKAERALMREHFREKYRLPKDGSDQRRVKAAGGNVRLSKELRAVLRHDEPRRQEESFVQLLSYRPLNTGATAETLQSNRRCLVM